MAFDMVALGLLVEASVFVIVARMAGVSTFWWRRPAWPYLRGPLPCCAHGCARPVEFPSLCCVWRECGRVMCCAPPPKTK